MTMVPNQQNIIGYILQGQGGGAPAILPLSRGCGSLYGPLKLRKFQLYTIINFLRYFYKPRSRNKVGMDDDDAGMMRSG